MMLRYFAHYSLIPPVSRIPFLNSGDFPKNVTYYQSKLIFSNTDNEPEKLWTSKTGYFNNFSNSKNLYDDEAVTFQMSGQKVNAINGMLNLGKLLLFGSDAEFSVQGNASGILTPSQINLKQHSSHGANSVNPIVMDNIGVYVQNRGSILRSIGFDFESDGYRGSDLSIFIPNF